MSKRRYGRELPISGRANHPRGNADPPRETILTRCLGRADKPATVVAHSSDSLIKPEIPKLDFDLPLGNRELVFSLHVLPGALVSCLQIGIVEKLPVNELRLRLNDPLAAQKIAAQVEAQTGYKSVSWQEANADLLPTFSVRDFIVLTVMGAMLLTSSFATYNLISTHHA